MVSELMRFHLLYIVAGCYVTGICYHASIVSTFEVSSDKLENVSLFGYRAAHY